MFRSVFSRLVPVAFSVTLSLIFSVLTPIAFVATSATPSIAEATSTRASKSHAAKPIASANRSIHFATAANGRAVRYELFQGEAGKPTYVTFNGLLYSQSYWDPFLEALHATGATIIRYSFSADPESLAGPSEAGAKRFSVKGVADEVRAVLDDTGVDRAILLTLSYGSIGLEVAIQYPERVERVVLMAPMVLPSDAYDAAGSATRAYLDGIRAVWGEAAYEIQWGLLMEPTVRALCHKRVTTLPNYIPAGLTANDVVAGAIEKIKATRDFDLRDYTKLDLPRIDLMLAEEEEGPLFEDQKEFWEQLPDAVKGNFVMVQKTAHAIPATAPQAALKALAIFALADGTEKRPYQTLVMDVDGKIVAK